MNAALAALLCLIVYALGYRFYSAYLATKIFALSDDHVTPAHAQEDGVDYVPTNKWVLFGHHYASIAGLGPLLGPAIAVIWGWAPAMLWVVGGALLVGCVHDFGALVVSMRARGQSIGKVTESVIGPRAKSLFHLIIFFLVALAMGVFAKVMAALFSPATAANPVGYPQAVIPSASLMILATVIGTLVYKKGFRLVPLTVLAFILVLGSIPLGMNEGVLAFTGLNEVGRAPSTDGWSWLLLIYAFAASVLPVWLLLQPRDFLNSLLLYLGMAAMFLGFFVLNPQFDAPAYQPHPDGAPSIFPFVFITIACGAASGFHGLVSSGTSSKQIAREPDARMVGYGGMVGESLLGLMAVLATTAGFGDATRWHEHYASWGAAGGLAQKIDAFIQGAGLFISQFGLPLGASQSFVALLVVSFALTSMDSGTRLLRYNIAEIAETLNLPWLGHRVVASLGAVAAIGFFCFFKINGKPAGLALWAIFGTSNQLLASLTLLVVSLYLLQRGRNALPTLLPMLFMMVSTGVAMAGQLRDFWAKDTMLLFGLCLGLLIMALWLIFEALLAFRRYQSGQTTESLQVEFKAG
ncbi:MAG: carbon starvation protein A [Chrysiogenetes bacterium]|nr:carbon starvation protein A [Chrysiogenetes bacterium]